SNMLGRAQPVSDGTGPTADVLEWRTSAWQPASDPLGSPANPDNGVGPGMTFGVGVVDHLPAGTMVGLIMCAKGEASIKEWLPDGGAYRACKTQVKAAGGHVA